MVRVSAFVSVYLDGAARAGAVRAVVAELPTPAGVFDITVDASSPSETFGCRIAVDLTGTFNEETDGPTIARTYAAQLSTALGVPAFAFHDLLRSDPER